MNSLSDLALLSLPGIPFPSKLKGEFRVGLWAVGKALTRYKAPYPEPPYPTYQFLFSYAKYQTIHKSCFFVIELRGYLGVGVSSPNAGFFSSDKQILGGIAGYFEKNWRSQTPTWVP